MSVIEAPSGVTEIVEAARGLSDQDLEQVVQELLSLRAERHGMALSPAETFLFARINAPLDPRVNRRYVDLMKKRDAGQLSEEEHAELLTLTDVVEEFDVRRLEAMAELAQLRGVSLRELYEQLGNPLPPHGKAA